MSSDSMSPDSVLSDSVALRRAVIAGVVALLVFALAILAVIVYAVDDHQTPGVVAPLDRNLAVAVAVASVVAAGATIAGYRLRDRPIWGRGCAMLGLVLSVCAGVVIVLMWV